MNKVLIYLILSITIVAFSVISLCSAPIINHNIPTYNNWPYDNCQLYADEEEKATTLNNQYKFHRDKTLCQRRKAMFGLEYASFIFDVICGFVCVLLSFLRYLNIGKGTEKNTGLVGLITGVIGFVLTFLYFVYSAYIFTNDTYTTSLNDPLTITNAQIKLFPNGASAKIDGTTPYSNDKGDNAQFIKYYELGQKQYNYDSDYYRLYYANTNYKCLDSKPDDLSCDYKYALAPSDSSKKYLYDKWVNTLIFSFVISVSNIGLIVFGLLLFKGGEK